MESAPPPYAGRLTLGGLTLSSPLVLAPLAGYTIPPLRALCRALGASLAFTEMVSAAGLVRASRQTRPLLERAPGEEPAGVQLFGARSDELAEAARIGAREGYQVVDLNLGCPVPKVCRTGAGAALLQDPPRAVALCAAVAAAVPLPVTVKLRLGWSEAERGVAERMIPGLVDAGVAAVTVHGRTRQQGYGGRADWEAIGRCRARARGAIPVFGSGDLFTAARAAEVLEQGLCDGVQVARGALADPWIFREASDLLHGRPARPAAPSELLACCRGLLAWLAARHGSDGGVRAFRSFFCRLVKGRSGAGRFREAVYRCGGLEALEALLVQAFPPEGAAITPRTSP